MPPGLDKSESVSVINLAKNYSGDDQCRLMYGENFAHCGALKVCFYLFVCFILLVIFRILYKRKPAPFGRTLLPSDDEIIHSAHAYQHTSSTL